jgi:hypothetical protein
MENEYVRPGYDMDYLNSLPPMPTYTEEDFKEILLERDIKMAKKMLANGYEVPFIAKIIELPEEELRNLTKQ